MTTSQWLMVFGGFFSVVVTIVLFLVGRLLNANKSVVDSIQLAVRDMAGNNQRAFRDLFSCIDALRGQIKENSVEIARIKGHEEGRKDQSAEVHHLHG